jgi:hypothetical protein
MRSIPTEAGFELETLIMSEQEQENTTSTPAPVLSGKRANWKIAHKVDMETSTITWQVKDAGELKLDLVKVHADNRERAMMHGFVQRISDAAAMARDAKTGASATPQEKFEAMRRLVEHYVSGAESWSPARSEGVRVVKVDQGRELLKMALGLWQPEKPQETIGQFVDGLKKEQVTALLISGQLKESVELAREELGKQEAEQAKGHDAEELLKGL